MRWRVDSGPSLAGTARRGEPPTPALWTNGAPVDDHLIKVPVC